MPRKVYVFRSGKCVEVGKASPTELHSVHQDTMAPLRHPKTGEMIESRTQWNAINSKYKLECVGNDLLSNHKHEIKEHITEERILDAYDKAESILSDPYKYNQHTNQNMARYERNQRLLSGKR